MSELVEDNFTSAFESGFSNNQQQQILDSSLLRSLSGYIARTHDENSNLKIFKIDKQKKIITLISHIKCFPSIFEVILNVKIDLKNRKLQFCVNFISQQNRCVKFSSPFRRSLCKKLLKFNQQLWKNGFKLVQNMQQGIISLLNVFEQSQYIFSQKYLIWSTVQCEIKRIHMILNRYKVQFAQIINSEKLKIFFLKNGSQQIQKFQSEQKVSLRLLKQIPISHIKFNFNQKEQIGTLTNISKVNNEQQNLKRLIMKISNHNIFQNSKNLYGNNMFNFRNNFDNQINFQLDSNQQSQYSTYLKTPNPKDPNSGQNKFIFNFIEIVNPQKVKLISTSKQGGINKIQISKMSFFYTSSSYISENPSRSSNIFNIHTNQDGKKQVLDPVLTKILAVKVPKYRNPQKTDDKYQNEGYIINLFKTGVSAYILKYYKSHQINFQYNKCLIMDYLPHSQPLSNFMEILKDTLSLNSKIFILVNVSNALRFIDDYQVVHMDLNLNNILVYKDYLIKLIDFGESYSPKLKSSYGVTFKRGYTFPFISPEYFERKNPFTIKQDIFSFGIIMYRFIFGQYPFFPSEKAINKYKNKTYEKIIMLAPQRGQYYGNCKAIDLIYRIIFKCLSANEKIRCQPTWLTIFLKLIYFHLM